MATTTTMKPNRKRRRQDDETENKSSVGDSSNDDKTSVVSRTSEMVLQILSASSSSSSYTEKQLKKILKEQQTESEQQDKELKGKKKKKQIKDALKLLVDEGRIVEEVHHDKGKKKKKKKTKSCYRVANAPSSYHLHGPLAPEPEKATLGVPEPSSRTTDNVSSLSILPIGLRLRQQEKQPKKTSDRFSSNHSGDEDSDNHDGEASDNDDKKVKAKMEHQETKGKNKKKKVQFVDIGDDTGEDDIGGGRDNIEGVDLDDEIARLERELAADNDSSSDDDDDDDDDEKEFPNETDGSGAVLSLSKFANDHVQHLPTTCLPAPSSKKVKNGRMVDANNVTMKNRQKSNNQGSNNNSRTTVNSGLQKAVQEVLQGYTARSADRLPFYCRFCAKQYKNEDEFFDHKRTEFHIAAVQTERKMTYCKLCRKQLTSPAQMKEHLKSKPHKERLSFMKNKHRSSGVHNR